jgi:hypothetical protein
MKAFCGKGIVGLGGRELINADVEFSSSKSKLGIQSLYGCGNAIGKVAYFKSACIGATEEALGSLTVGEHKGSSFPNVLLNRHPALQQRIASML